MLPQPPAARIVPELCTDPPGVDRVAVHDAPNRDAIAFYQATLR